MKFGFNRPRSHGSDKGKIRFVSTGENRGKPCPVCKKMLSYMSGCKTTLVHDVRSSF